MKNAKRNAKWILNPRKGRFAPAAAGGLLTLGLLGCAAHTELPSAVHTAAGLASAVKVVPDVPYGTQPRQTLDLYLLKTPSPPPVLLAFHGGGWLAHSKEEIVIDLLPYLALGFAVANVEYRLAGDAAAPAAVEDARCALNWVIRHGREYYVDPGRIVLAGGSAGGHLALMAGLVPPGSELDRECPSGPADPPAPPVHAILNWGGPSDLRELVAGPESRDFARQWLSPTGELDEAELLAAAERLSPLRQVRAGGPPVLTVHGDRDPLIPYPQSVRFHAALSEAGVRNRLCTIPGGGHGPFEGAELIGAFEAIREFLGECGLAEAGPVP